MKEKKFNQSSEKDSVVKLDKDKLSIFDRRPKEMELTKQPMINERSKSSIS